MPASKTRKRIDYKQVWTKPNGGYSDWHFLGTEKQIDVCCDCGLVHEVQFAAFRRKGTKIGKVLPRGQVVIARRVRLAPRRTAAKRRSKRLQPVAKAVKRRRN